MRIRNIANDCDGDNLRFYGDMDHEVVNRSWCFVYENVRPAKGAPKLKDLMMMHPNCSNESGTFQLVKKFDENVTYIVLL